MLETVIGGAAVFIFVGAEIVVMTWNLLAEARIINGVLYTAGPENTLIAIFADATARIGSKDRQLTQDEYNWERSNVQGDFTATREDLPHRRQRQRQPSLHNPSIR